MKSLNLTILFALIYSLCFSQDSLDTPITLNKIPPQGILLNRGWKFHPGDNLEWANKDFDDHLWKSVNPASDIYDLDIKHDGIGWFRLKVKVDPSQLGKTFALVIAQVGASEILLNGKLLYRFGVVSAEFNKERTYNLRKQPFILQLAKDTIQEISVRYSFNKNNFLLNYINPNPCLELTIKDPVEGSIDYRESEIDTLPDTFLFPLFLLMGLLCLAFYFGLRKEKAYLYLGIFCFGFAGTILFALLSVMQKSTTLSSAIHFLGHLCAVVSALFILNSFYILFQKKKPWYYFIILLYAIVTIPFFFIFYKWSSIFALLFYPIVELEWFRFTILAVREKRPGALPIFIMLCCFYISFVSFIVLIALGKYREAIVINTVADFTIPIGIIIFMGGEFARTGLSLQARVVEVEQLSRKAISQEQEKQKILADQNETLEIEVKQRTAELNHSLNELKDTQKQLIQAEKMASLGELTAGIAHEIQNPLNFVNNFSDINKELLEEMEEEIQKGNIDEVRAIAKDVLENEYKINHHGKRADAIVKGMLQHSKSSSGPKDYTDINILVDEYLRLAYLSFRSKQKDFTTELKTEFDSSIDKLNIIPQDIGRVLLNICSNAFYAVEEKGKLNTEGYKPVVSVSTHKLNGSIEIKIRDNGNGIAEKNLDKVFQPFFTTKPTGKGTGLGLSLSYDIVKAHGGELKVKSKEGEYAEFVIQLPFTVR